MPTVTNPQSRLGNAVAELLAAKPTRALAGGGTAPQLNAAQYTPVPEAEEAGFPWAWIYDIPSEDESQITLAIALHCDAVLSAEDRDSAFELAYAVRGVLRQALHTGRLGDDFALGGVGVVDFTPVGNTLDEETGAALPAAFVAVIRLRAQWLEY